MAAKGYSSPALVAEELGRTLTAGQITQVDGLVESAEAYIDRYTGRAWLVVSPVTDELHTPASGLVYLERRPVLTITSVSVRSTALGSAWTALVSGTGYELLDAANGVLSLGGGYPTDVVINTMSAGADSLARVTYTYTSPLPLPADIRRAATLLVASWMLPRLDPSMASVAKVSVGQGDLSLEYRDTQDAEHPIPPLVTVLLASYRRLVFA